LLLHACAGACSRTSTPWSTCCACATCHAHKSSLLCPSHRPAQSRSWSGKGKACAICILCIPWQQCVCTLMLNISAIKRVAHATRRTQSTSLDTGSRFLLSCFIVFSCPSKVVEYGFPYHSIMFEGGGTCFSCFATFVPCSLPEFQVPWPLLCLRPMCPPYLGPCHTRPLRTLHTCRAAAMHSAEALWHHACSVWKGMQHLERQSAAKR